MDRHRQNVNGYVYGLTLMAAAFLMGCSGRKREDFSPPLSLSAGETVSMGGITIEVADEAKKETSPESGQDSQNGREDVPENNGGYGQAEGDGLNVSLEQIYPGEILSKEDVERRGEDEFFSVSAISDQVFQRMEGNSYRPGCPVERDELRYLTILHYDFSGNIRVGELVCHQSVARDMKRIFRELYEAEYPIEKVALIDDYGGDDELSSQDNNTSCFNFRTVAGSDKLSLHALGVAIDVNPLYNPYITWNEQGESICAPSNGTAYMDRSQDFPYKIDEDDLCCRLFLEARFTWGGNWEGQRDYMHFSRGFRPKT